MKSVERFALANEQAKGKVVERLVREFPRTLSVEFSDGTDLLVECEGEWMEISLDPREEIKEPPNFS